MRTSYKAINGKTYLIHRMPDGQYVSIEKPRPRHKYDGRAEKMFEVLNVIFWIWLILHLLGCDH